MKRIKLAGLLIIPAALWLGGCNTTDTAEPNSETIAVAPKLESDSMEIVTSEGSYKGLIKDFHGLSQALGNTTGNVSGTSAPIRDLVLMANSSSMS
ncbi:MAG: hypothetical protein ABI036_10380 [Fibrobacteria bacterium]